MSTTSTATTSVVRDLTLGDDIVNHICILAATLGDGIPFYPDSLQEEDVVKLCMGLGQAHLEVVLWLSDTETVLAFQSGSEMMATMHLFTKAMVWHDEPIKICVHPPTGMQVQEYMASKGRHPSDTQVQILGGEVFSVFPQ